MKLRLKICSLLLSSSFLAAAATPDKVLPNTPTIRIVPVMPAPESNNVTVAILQPQVGEVLEGNPINIQVLLFWISPRDRY